MKMHDQTPGYFHKLIPKFIAEWSVISDNSAPLSGEMTIRQLSGQGATSDYFLLSIVDAELIRQKFFVKKYGGSSTNKGKAYWRKQAEKDFNVSKFLATLLDDQHSFNVVRPYWFFSDENVVVYPYVEGENLSHIFYKSLRTPILNRFCLNELEDKVKQIGGGLAYLQSIPMDSMQEVLESPDSAEICSQTLTNFEQFISYFQKENVFPELLIPAKNSITEVLTDYFATNSFYCFQHTDFILQNFSFDKKGGKTYLFDLPLATIGTPYVDAAHFVHSLDDLTYLRTVPQNEVAHLAKTFLDYLNREQTFDYQVYFAFQLYYQFYSTMIILLNSRKKKRFRALRSLVIENEVVRFEKNVTYLLLQLAK